jgi:hypothetical protein
MLTGDRAFNGNSPADTISAILTKEPPDLSTGPRFRRRSAASSATV